MARDSHLVTFPVCVVGFHQTRRMANTLSVGLKGSCFRPPITDSLIPIQMRVGVFTPLLSQLPLAEVLKKLKANGIDTVELGTGNYPGDAHCKLSMLKDRAALDDIQEDHRGSRLLDQRAELPRKSAASGSRHRARARSGDQPQDDSAGREAGRARGGRFFGLPGRFAATRSIRTGSPARGRRSIWRC